MKKLLAVILSLIMVLTFAACGTQTEEESGNNKNDTSKNSTSKNDGLVSDNDETSNGNDKTSNGNDEQQYEHTGKKIEGNIAAASPFSEGLAFVKLQNESGKTYCINKEGYIVFELDMELSSDRFSGIISEKFVNGLAVINPYAPEGTPRMLCDTKGYVATPEDLGVTDISGAALEGGYLIVEKVTSSYDSAKRELGVMDRQLNWVVEPSEDVYTDLFTYVANNGETHTDTFRGLIDEYCHFFNDILSIETGNKKYLNLKTGEVYDTISSYGIPSNVWELRTEEDANNNDYYAFTWRRNNGPDALNIIMLSLKDVKNVSSVQGTEFVNKKSPLAFYNEESRTFFFTLIDEQGSFLFDPIEFKDIKDMRFSFDGEHLLVKGSKADDDMHPTIIFKCYNSKGELLGEKLFTTDYTKPTWFTYEYGYISDGVICESLRYYKTDFTELF